MLALGDRWKTQVIGGEITWGWGSLRLKGLKGLEGCLADDFTRTLVIEQVRNLHCNHLGGVTWADFNNEEFLEHLALVQKAMGYRYVLDKASYPERIDNGRKWKIDFSLVNTGSSPFYYSWPVEVALLDPQTHKKVWGDVIENVDIATWMPGEQWSVEENKYLVAPEKYEIKGKLSFDGLPDGEYIMALAILDPAGNVPSVRFANTNYVEGGYTVLGYVGVGCDIDDPKIDASLFDDIQADRTLRYYID